MYFIVCKAKDHNYCLQTLAHSPVSQTRQALLRPILLVMSRQRIRITWEVTNLENQGFEE